MNKGIILTMLMVATGCVPQDKPVASTMSPNGRNEIRLYVQPLAYEVLHNGKVVVAKSVIGMKVNGTALDPTKRKPMVSTKTITGIESTPVYKKSSVDLAGNETKVNFGDWSVYLAARDDGVAYRFETTMAGKVTIDCERAEVTIPSKVDRCSINYGTSYGCEETAALGLAADEIKTGEDNQKYVYLPLVYTHNGTTVAFTESDVYDYPILNLVKMSGKESEQGVTMGSEFAKWPTKCDRTMEGKDWHHQVVLSTGGRWVKVRETADYLVATEGTRSYPWRTFVLVDEPSQLVEADIVYALARTPTTKRDFSWVKPGKVSWEWWNSWDNQGRSKGCNTATYKRFVDFAAANGIEYVILDEGWSEKLNIWKFDENVDVPEIIRYANERKVGIILWIAWAQAYENEAKVAEHFAKLGAKGFKVDFMDRGDAEVERFLWKFAEECAKNKMVVDYHGAHRPTGMSRAYPNVLNYEGIYGLEQMKFYHGQDIIGNDVRAVFGRMTAGPMDYTPGAMDQYFNCPYTGNYQNPGSFGTRARQMAMMVAYEAPLQMLCDAPTKYEKNRESFDFMAKVPVVWANTIGLGGTPDTFVALARQTADGSWYAAAINGKEPRTFVLNTAFLVGGVWEAEIFGDVKAHYTKTIRAGEMLNMPMSFGGGFVIRFVKQ